MLRIVANAAPIVTIAAIVTLAVMGSFTQASPLFISLYAVAIALTVWARTAFPKGAFRATAAPGGQQVIRRGPYRLVRHPMYTGALLLIWSAAFARVSMLSATIAAVATAAVVCRVVWEERLLRDAFPDYGDYARSTRALIPFVI